MAIWNKLSTGWVNVSRVNMFKNKIDTFRIKVDYTWRILCWTRYANGFLVHLVSGACCLAWKNTCGGLW